METAALPWWLGRGRYRAIGGLGQRILLWTAGLSLVPLLVMAYQGYHCARQAVVASVTVNLQTIAASRAERVRTWLDERRKEMALLGSARDCLVAVASGERAAEEPCRHVEEFKRETDGYEAIYLFDVSWRKIGPADTTPHFLPELEKSHVRRRIAEARDPLVFPIHSHENGSVAIHMAAPLREAKGSLWGYVVAVLDPSPTLSPIVEDRTGLGRTGKTYLVSTDKRIVAGVLGDRGESEMGRLVDTAGVRAALAGSEGSGFYRDYRGVEVVGGYTWLAGPQWGLVAEMDAGEALAWLGVLKRRAAVVGLLTLAAVVLFSSIGAQRLGRPMRHLAMVARRVGEGQTGERVMEFGPDELGEVGRAFNDMLDELKKAEGEVRRTAALAAVGELSSSIVHELRNPLSSVKMNLQALVTRVAGDPVYSELAGIAFEQVRRVERMLNDLLGFGRPLKLNFAPIAISEVLKRVTELLHPQAAASQTRVVVEDEISPDTVLADAEQLGIALSNLLKNAVEAAGEGGEVAVKAVPGPSPEQWTLEVSDNGPGFPAGQAMDIFKPFFTTKEQGTGLGLANVKKIVQLHAGAVVAENRPGGGATFRITLPRRPG